MPDVAYSSIPTSTADESKIQLLAGPVKTNKQTDPIVQLQLLQQQHRGQTRGLTEDAYQGESAVEGIRLEESRAIYKIYPYLQRHFKWALELGNKAKRY